jgi:hypothetical protein
VSSNEELRCPKCGEAVHGYDHRYRIQKYFGGKITILKVPRVKCENSRCSCDLLTVLPDTVIPYKHYSADVIQKAVDLSVSPYSPEVENYPTDETFEDWKEWFEGNLNNTVHVLESVSHRVTELANIDQSSSSSLLEHIRIIKTHWLRYLNWLICAAGSAFRTLRSLRINPPAFLLALNVSEIESMHKGGRWRWKT